MNNTLLQNKIVFGLLKTNIYIKIENLENGYWHAMCNEEWPFSLGIILLLDGGSVAVQLSY